MGQKAQVLKTTSPRDPTCPSDAIISTAIAATGSSTFGSSNVGESDNDDSDIVSGCRAGLAGWLAAGTAEGQGGG